MLEPYPGAEVRQQITSPPSAQTLVFATTATEAQVTQHYRALLEIQGWSFSSTAYLIDYRSCPKLSLNIKAIAQNGDITVYRVDFEQYPCRTIC